jgi:hypothetical protein
MGWTTVLSTKYSKHINWTEGILYMCILRFLNHNWLCQLSVVNTSSFKADKSTPNMVVSKHVSYFDSMNHNWSSVFIFLNSCERFCRFLTCNDNPLWVSRTARNCSPQNSYKINANSPFQFELIVFLDMIYVYCKHCSFVMPLISFITVYFPCK